MGRRKKNTELPLTNNEANGKDYVKEAILLQTTKKSLDAIWGFKHSKYKTEDENVYTNEMKKLSKLELQKECTRVGLYPNDNRELMIQRLVKQFKQYVTAANTSGISPKPIIANDKAREILSRLAGNNLV